MCVILAAVKNKPDLELLKDCEAANGHGGGMAWRENGFVKFEKGLDSDKIFEIVQRVELPFVIHYRLATAGGKSDELCHPFIVSKESPLLKKGEAKKWKLLFHNGHWSDYSSVLHKIQPNLIGPVSDSRLIAYICSTFNTNDTGIDVLLKIIGDRFAIFSNEQMELFGHWQEENGIYFSNQFFKWRKQAGNFNNNKINNLNNFRGESRINGPHFDEYGEYYCG